VFLILFGIKKSTIPFLRKAFSPSPRNHLSRRMFFSSGEEVLVSYRPLSALLVERGLPSLAPAMKP